MTDEEAKEVDCNFEKQQSELAVVQQNRSSQFSICGVFLLANCACIVYSIMQALIKDLQVNEGLSVVEISLIRSSSILIASGCAVCITK